MRGTITLRKGRAQATLEWSGQTHFEGTCEIHGDRGIAKHVSAAVDAPPAIGHHPTLGERPTTWRMGEWPHVLVFADSFARSEGYAMRVGDNPGLPWKDDGENGPLEGWAVSIWPDTEPAGGGGQTAKALTFTDLPDALRKAESARPPGGGWKPIEHGKHGGMVKVVGGKRRYWYPSDKHATSAGEHHEQAGLAAALSGDDALHAKHGAARDGALKFASDARARAHVAQHGITIGDAKRAKKFRTKVEATKAARAAGLGGASPERHDLRFAGRTWLLRIADGYLSVEGLYVRVADRAQKALTFADLLRKAEQLSLFGDDPEPLPKPTPAPVRPKPKPAPKVETPAPASRPTKFSLNSTLYNDVWEASVEAWGDEPGGARGAFVDAMHAATATRNSDGDAVFVLALDGVARKVAAAADGPFAVAADAAEADSNRTDSHIHAAVLREARDRAKRAESPRTSEEPKKGARDGQKAKKPSRATQKPPGAGWQPIPKGKKGGYRKRQGNKWIYWYPDTGQASRPRHDDHISVHAEHEKAEPEPEPTPEPKPAEKRPARKRASGTGGGKAEPRGDHQEVGDVHVGGSRADQAARFREALQTGDNSHLSSSEQKSLYTKAKVFPKPDQETHKAMGGTPGGYRMKEWLHAQITTRPPDDSPDGRRQYVESCDFVARSLTACRTAEDVITFLQDFGMLCMGYQAGERETVTRVEYYDNWLPRAGEAPTQHNPLAGDYEKKTRTTYEPHPELPQVVHGDRESKRRAARENPYIHKLIALGPKLRKRLDHRWTDGDRKAWREATQLDELGWDDAEALKESRKEKRKKDRAAGGGKRAFRWSRRAPDGVTRVGGHEVAKADGQAMADEFGLLNVQYGNWTSQGDRDEHVRSCHGALRDLAEITGIDPQQVSFNGRLSMGIGARGKGKARAHYEAHAPLYKDGEKVGDGPIINLTKFAGGGSLAHEWGHALDHMMSVLGAGHDLTDRVFPSNAHEHLALPPEVAEAYSAVMDAIEGPRRGLRAKYRAAEREWQAASEAHGSGSPEARAIGRRMRDLARAEARPTDYLLHAQALGGQKDAEKVGYWERRHEMFARAFESYIEDTLQEGDRRNTYLVVGTQGTYPTGKIVAGTKKTTESESEATKQAGAAYSAARDAHWNAVQEVIAQRSRSWKDEHRGREPAMSRSTKWFQEEYWNRTRHGETIERMRAAKKVYDESRKTETVTTTGTEAQPYPQGEERTQINAAFARFLKAVNASGVLKKAIEALFGGWDRPATFTDLLDILKGNRPGGAGWTKIPNTKHDGWSRVRGGKRQYWYPDRDKAAAAAEHHEAVAASYLKQTARHREADREGPARWTQQQHEDHASHAAGAREHVSAADATAEAGDATSAETVSRKAEKKGRVAAPMAGTRVLMHVDVNDRLREHVVHRFRDAEGEHEKAAVATLAGAPLHRHPYHRTEPFDADVAGALLTMLKEVEQDPGEEDTKHVQRAAKNLQRQLRIKRDKAASREERERKRRDTAVRSARGERRTPGPKVVQWSSKKPSGATTVQRRKVPGENAWEATVNGIAVVKVSRHRRRREHWVGGRPTYMERMRMLPEGLREAYGIDILVTSPSRFGKHDIAAKTAGGDSLLEDSGAAITVQTVVRHLNHLASELHGEGEIEEPKAFWSARKSLIT